MKKTHSIVFFLSVVFLLLIGIRDVYAQNTSFDDTTRIRMLNEKAFDFNEQNLNDSSLYYASRGLELVNQLLKASKASNGSSLGNYLKLLKAKSLAQIAESISGANPEPALDTLKQALDLMRETGDIDEQAIIYSAMANIYDFQVKPDEALKYYQKSIDIFRETGNKALLSISLTDLGITQRNMRNYGDALESLMEASKINEELKDSIAMTENLLAIGFVYMYLEHWDDALKAQQQALEIYKSMNDSLGIARIYNDMGAVNQKAGNLQAALEQHNAALKIRLNSTEYYYTFASYYYIGNIYDDLGKYREAIRNYESSLEYAKLAGYKISIVDAHVSAGLGYFNLQLYDKALEHFMEAQEISREFEDRTGFAQASVKIAEIYSIRNKPQEALHWMKEAEQAAPKSDFAFLDDIYLGIAQGYAKLGDYRNAFENMEFYNQIRDSIIKVENLEKVTTLTSKLDFENRQALQKESQEKMIVLKQAEIDRQKILKYFMLFGMLVILVLAVVFYIRFVEKNKLSVKLKTAFSDLKSTQAQLIHSEKMASLGELSAGIAHEIQNPLNFINNFSEVNTELISEMKEEIEKGNIDELKAIFEDFVINEEKIIQHGKRADAIVKGMLQHSRTNSGQKEPTDINALADEYLRLAFHGLRAKDKSFNADFKMELDKNLPKINIIPQDISRVILNLINNAFYAVAEKSQSIKKASATSPEQTGLDKYNPMVVVTTKKLPDKIEIRVKDNGGGIPDSVKDKIFRPFFTTKPSGLGTGLGLSLSFEIINAHGGALKLETKEGEGTEFIIQLPA